MGRRQARPVAQASRREAEGPSGRIAEEEFDQVIGLAPEGSAISKIEKIKNL